MFKAIRLWFMLLIIVGGLGIAACGGDDDDNGDQPAATAAADDTPEDGDTTPSDGGNGDGDGAFGDIPVPDGASEVDSGSFSGTEVPFIDPTGDIDASAYGDIEYKSYETSDSAESVIDFYSDELSGWDEAYKFSGGGEGGAGGFGIWTRDDGNQALWVGASEDGSGTTTVTVILGSAS